VIHGTAGFAASLLALSSILCLDVGIIQVMELGIFLGLMTTISDSFYKVKEVRLMLEGYTLSVWIF
jgi:hypothetical protein